MLLSFKCLLTPYLFSFVPSVKLHMRDNLDVSLLWGNRVPPYSLSILLIICIVRGRPKPNVGKVFLATSLHSISFPKLFMYSFLSKRSYFLNNTYSKKQIIHLWMGVVSPVAVAFFFVPRSISR